MFIAWSRVCLLFFYYYPHSSYIHIFVCVCSRSYSVPFSLSLSLSLCISFGLSLSPCHGFSISPMFMFIYVHCTHITHIRCISWTNPFIFETVFGLNLTYHFHVTWTNQGDDIEFHYIKQRLYDWWNYYSYSIFFGTIYSTKLRLWLIIWENHRRNNLQ